VLICHAGEPLNRFGMARWMASFMNLAAVVEIHEPRGYVWRRMRREYRRAGLRGLADVLAFRAYSRLVLDAADAAWEAGRLAQIEKCYPELPPATRVLETASPNSAATEELLREIAPDLIVARCKILLQPRIFKQARLGTFIMHPGICPEYRNSHGCFWALAMRDLENVGMTLLKIDEGVDTGPVYGYYRCRYDERRETHNMIQNRMVFDNLDALRAKFEEILAGTARTIDTRGRPSRTWGKPWLTRYWRWKRMARGEAAAR